MTDLDIAALRHRAEMAEKFANDGPDAPILDGRLRVFAKDLLALLDAAEERDALRAQRDGLLAAAEAFCAALNARAGKSLGEKRPPISTVIHAGEALNAAIRAAKGQP